MKKPLADIPAIPDFASFGAKRKFDIHTGIDLHCSEGSEVFAMEEGLVKQVAQFTGAAVNSPWWEDTFFIGILGSSGYIVYGEVNPVVKVGDQVLAGQLIGHVKRVLKNDKGISPSMLHLEWYEKEVADPVVWELNQSQPELLLDATKLLNKIKS